MPCAYVWQRSSNRMPSTGCADLPAQDEVGGQADDEEADQQRQDGAHEQTVLHVELFEDFRGELVVAVRLGAGQVVALESVDGQHGSFERVAHEADVADPAHVARDGVQVDEESGEEQERDGDGRSDEDGDLDVGRRPHQQADPLSHQTVGDADGREHEEARHFHRLVGH